MIWYDETIFYSRLKNNNNSLLENPPLLEWLMPLSSQWHNHRISPNSPWLQSKTFYSREVARSATETCSITSENKLLIHPLVSWFDLSHLHLVNLKLKSCLIYTDTKFQEFVSNLATRKFEVLPYLTSVLKFPGKSPISKCFCFY